MYIEERRVILKRLVTEYGLDLVAAYSAKKNEAKLRKVKVFKENKIDDVLKQEITTEQYLKRIDDGYYDDGYVICCGVIRRGQYQGYKFVYVDIDKKLGLHLFLTHGDRNATIEQIAESRWVEYNGIDRDQHVHIPYIIEPDVDLSAKGADDVVGIEVNTNGVMFSVGAPHHLGGFYQLLGKSDKIRVIDKTLAFALQERVRSVCEYKGVHYFDKNNDEQKAALHQAYSAHLHDDGTRIGIGAKHETIKFVCCSYFNKYEGEWDNLTEDQRKERVLGFDKLKCDPPLHETDPLEFEDLWTWVKKTFRVERDKAKEQREDVKRQTEQKYKEDLIGKSEAKQELFKRYNEDIRKVLSGNIWSELEKDNWIIADLKENIIYKSYFVDKTSGKHRLIAFCKGPRCLKCVPTHIKKHENPLHFLNPQLTYTFTFRDAVGKTHTLVRKTLDEIAEWLKNQGYIMPTGRRGGTIIEILSAMIDAFREDGRLEIDKSISTPGVYYLDGRLVFVGLDEYIERYRKQTIQQRKEAIKFVEDLIKKFRIGIVPTALKVAVLSPFDFALKQYTDDIVYIRSLFPFGWSKTDKSTVSNIPIWMYFNSEADRKVPFTSINSEARLGYFVSQDTLPVHIYEMKVLNDPKNKQAVLIIEMFKAIIETKEARGTMNKQSTVKTKCLSLNQVNFSSNARPPLDAAFNTRIIRQIFTQKDVHTHAQKKTFHAFMKNKHLFRIWGDFIIAYIHDHQIEIIFKEDKESIDWEECSKSLITKFYELSGEPPPDHWIDLPLTNAEDEDDYETNEINNVIDALRTALVNYFNEAYNKYIRNLGEEEEVGEYGNRKVKTILPMNERIAFCIENGITPCFTKGAKGKLIILHSILEELENRGIGSDRIGSMTELKELFAMEYAPIRLNGRLMKCVYGNVQKIYDFVEVTDVEYMESKIFGYSS